ncbi:MAG: HlyD family efflux transporter periplasmic adaptor subunit [Victivallaceae bacterium]|nr:HlyD family efflux transporter periplasmic adaptor subunit [Victivallaceae bacterium]
MRKRIITIAIIAAVAIAAGVYAFIEYKKNQAYWHPTFFSGNGRIEATEIYISARVAERISEIYVKEGDFVKKGDKLVQMNVDTLNAQYNQAVAKRKQAETTMQSKQAEVAQQEASLAAAIADKEKKATTLENDRKTYERQKTLYEKRAQSLQTVEDKEKIYKQSMGELLQAEAMVKQCEAAIAKVKAEVNKAEAEIQAAEAEMQRIQADIKDSTLYAPLDGRIQYLIQHTGETVQAGGRILNLVDLTDVYMTFFLPEHVAGKLAVDSDARIVLDAGKSFSIPAKITYVASVAQFTPKTVETQVERQKMMFRTKASIDPMLLRQYIQYVKTGLPGVAWVKVDPEASWSDSPISDIADDEQPHIEKIEQAKPKTVK